MKKMTRNVLYVTLLNLTVIIIAIIFGNWIYDLTTIESTLIECSNFHNRTYIFIPSIMVNIMIILIQVVADWFQTGKDKKWKNNVSTVITIISTIILIITALKLIYSILIGSYDIGLDISIFIMILSTATSIGFIIKNLNDELSKTNDEIDENIKEE